MRITLALTLSLFLVNAAHAQTLLTAEGLAAFDSVVSTNGGGGGSVQRFYFPSDSVAPVSPGFSASWHKTDQATRAKMVSTKTGSTSSFFTSESSTNELESYVLVRQYISDPIASQTISGSISGFVRCYENNQNCNAYLAVNVRVVSSDGSTVRGTLLDVTSPNLGELNGNTTTGDFTPLSRAFLDGSESNPVLTEVSASSGDRLVVEIGYHESNSFSPTRQAYFDFRDDAASDFTANDESSELNPWIEFSSAIQMQ